MNTSALTGNALILVCLFFLAGCGGGGSMQSPPPTPEPLTITTTSLPNGTMNTPYSTALRAQGGVPPRNVEWRILASGPFAE